MEKETMNEILESLKFTENLKDYSNSKGVIILENGIFIKMDKMFNYFRDSWMIYSRLNTMNHMDEESKESNEEKRKEMFSLNDGIISDWMITVKLETVSAMISEESFKKMTFNHNNNDDDYNDNEDEDYDN